MIIKLIKPAVILFSLLVILTGVLYPLAVTGISQWLFLAQANGSIIFKDSQAVGSGLIGQSFDQSQYFWGRLSATGNYPYNASASSGSNLSVLNIKLQDNVQQRIEALKQADPDNSLPIPVDLVTSSGSGLDPNISPAAAHYQAARVAKSRHIPPEKIETLINQYTEERTFGLFGEPRVNVLELNLALDALQ